MIENSDKHVVVVGAGPAGLTAALELSKQGISTTVLEQHDKVGGLARTESFKGYSFDMGGHRFFTKAKAASTLWRETLGSDLMKRPRLSRIYYQNRFFDYPLKAFNALVGLGIWQAILVIVSFIRWQLFPYRREETFEQWVTNRFGKRLFEIFFKTYTEKVWGIACSKLSADWAAQRIKDLSLTTALLSMFVKPGSRIKSLIEEFEYPRLGPGMLWNRVRERIERGHGRVRLNSSVTRLIRDDKRIVSVVASCDGGEEVITASDFISSMPLSELIERLDPVPPAVLQAARRLKYRDFLTVCLIIGKADLFPDNWIYVHSPEVKVGRIQNFKNWSPEMAPDPGKTSLGLEYFCTEGDQLWTLPDSELIELAKREVARVGLANYADVEDGHVFRVPKAYPIYDSTYLDDLAILQSFVDGHENLQTIGRNGLHRYNNMDHSMVTGMLAARNIILGEKNDVWNVNSDPEYQEVIRGPEAEMQDVLKVMQKTLAQVFAKLDPVALGCAVGATAGMLVFLATVLLLLKEGGQVGPNLALLAQFFPGYSVSLPGSLIGLLYGSATGFGVGWAFAVLRNLAVFISTAALMREVDWHLLQDILA